MFSLTCASIPSGWMDACAPLRCSSSQRLVWVPAAGHSSATAAKGMLNAALTHIHFNTFIIPSSLLTFADIGRCTGRRTPASRLLLETPPVVLGQTGACGDRRGIRLPALDQQQDNHVVGAARVVLVELHGGREFGFRQIQPSA